MKDFEALLKSQEIDLDRSTAINRALEINGELAKLKAENEKLKKENRLWKDKEDLLLEELKEREERLAAAEVEVRRLKEETSRQKVSLDSVFSDLEESKNLIMKLRNERVDKKFGSGSKLIDPEIKEENQAQFLTPVVEKPAQSHGFFASIGGANSAQQRKIYNLEKENVKLKSDLVRLQAQYREESYLNRKAIEELVQEHATASSTTESTDSSLSQNEHSDDSTTSISTGEEQHSRRRSNLARSNSLRRIQELKERKTPSATTSSMVPSGASKIRQPPQRIGSLQGNLLARESSMMMIDSAARIIQHGSRRSGATTNDGSPPSRASNSPGIPTRSPRRLESLHQERSPQINLHEVGKEESSRGSLFGRSQQPILRMGWGWGK